MMPSLNVDLDDSDGASPEGTERTPRGLDRASLERPVREPARSSGAARRRRARDAAAADGVDGLADFIADLGGLVGAFDPFAVDHSTSRRMLSDLDAAVRRTSVGGLRHTPGVTRAAKWIGTVDPTGVVKSLLSAYDLAYDDLDVASMQLALDRLNEHAAVAHGRFSAEKAFLKTAVTNARSSSAAFSKNTWAMQCKERWAFTTPGTRFCLKRVARRLLQRCSSRRCGHGPDWLAAR